MTWNLWRVGQHFERKRSLRKNINNSKSFNQLYSKKRPWRNEETHRTWVQRHPSFSRNTYRTHCSQKQNTFLLHDRNIFCFWKQCFPHSLGWKHWENIRSLRMSLEICFHVFPGPKRTWNINPWKTVQLHNYVDKRSKLIIPEFREPSMKIKFPKLTNNCHSQGENHLVLYLHYLS